MAMQKKFVPSGNRKPHICVVVGTRPGIVKMSPIIRELSNRGIPFFVLHTGQHYSPNMDGQFFVDLELPTPRFHLKSVKNFSTHASQTAEMMKGIEDVLFQERPAMVLVCGDANTNLSGALAARKLGLIVGHVESGLRSYDWRMPEEHNRVIMDHISELLYAPTDQAKQNLLNESVRGKIFVTGNTIVDATLQNIEIAQRRNSVLVRFGLQDKDYALVTIHREENVDEPRVLSKVIDTIIDVSCRYRNQQFVFPIHPRTRKRMEECGVGSAFQGVENVKIVDPVGYLDFLLLISRAAVVVTDSGGIQEEACILRVPCVTMRDNTERPESVEVGANVLAGIDSQMVGDCIAAMLNRPRNWPNPFGTGKAAVEIVDTTAAILAGKLDMSEFRTS